MSTGIIDVICGEKGSGKSSMALGKALQALNRGRQVVIIQFLKGNRKQENLEFYKRLEPEMKLFCFEKAERYFEDLTPEEQQEECINIRNGLNYAKKVLSTGECDLLVLDEVLGLVDRGIVPAETLLSILECRDTADVILTGNALPETVAHVADRVEKVAVLTELVIDKGQG